MKYAIKVLEERLDFLKGRVGYAKYIKDNFLEEKLKEKSEEIRKAIQILQTS